MPSQIDLDKTYLKMAHEWGQLSKAKRKKVGCLVVKNGQIISDGYNGTPSGMDNECEYEYNGKLITKPVVLHAESNALMKLAKSNNNSNGATIYLSISPCFDCSKLIVQAGISRVVYKEKYRDNSGLLLLEENNIKHECVK
jgi:dCMP deaminase